MQRGEDERATTPLGGRVLNGESQMNGEGSAHANALNSPTSVPVPAPTNVRMMRPAGETPRMGGAPPLAASGAQPGAAPLSSEELELERIREILVGPHLRDHERRLRMVERHAADLRATASSSEWRSQVEAAIERGNQASMAQTQALQHEQARIQALQAELARERQAREALVLAQQHQQQQAAPTHGGAEVEAVRAELAHERQVREAQAQDAERAVSQLAARLDQEREEHEVHLRELQSLRLEQQALRAELTRERGAYDEQGTRHTQALANMATRVEHVDQRHEEHAGEHQQSAAELDARLERERQAHAQQVERLEAAHGERLNQMTVAHNSQVEGLHQLVADAERALVAMQAEREHLAGLLAELGMHLVRHAASPAAARADDESQTFLKAAAWWRRRPRG